MKKWKGAAKLDPEVQLLDTGAVKRPHEDSESESKESESKSDSRDAKAPLKSRLALWAEGDDVAHTLKLLHRLLEQVEKIGEDQVRRGRPNFGLEHLRKCNAKFDVLRSDDLLFDLLSPRMANELELAVMGPDEGEDDEGEDDEGEDDNEEQENLEQENLVQENLVQENLEPLNVIVSREDKNHRIHQWLGGLRTRRFGGPL